MSRATAAIGAALLGATSLAAGCSSSSTVDAAPASSCDVRIDRFKELLVVDEAVINDPRSRNTESGAWSFRHVIESMAPEDRSTSAFVESWLDDWVNTAVVNGYKTEPLPESRVGPMQSIVVCPWLSRTPENGCNASCTTCTGRKLDLAKAPFRLIAIANRTDLRKRPGLSSPAGEGRLVFALTEGAADDPGSRSLPMTVIAEYALPSSSSPAEWVAQWHSLSRHDAFDEAYKKELQALTDRFVGRNAAPGRANGSALAQVRTSESTLNWVWQLREFKLDGAGQLRVAPLLNTPADELNASPLLRDYVIANRAAILADEHVVPDSMLGGAASQLQPWSVPDVDEATRHAFAAGTCNGCHSEKPTVDKAFHISPHLPGVAKVSDFLFDRQHPENDELHRREELARELLCPSTPRP